ncbi:MAG TPA: class II aldolase/adducin family protein [Bacteroidota bacterium]|nr:class II aldolase/adducin family protein [Bacteroidota bacterium]
MQSIPKIPTEMQSRADIAHAIVLACHRLYEKGFVTATDGNVSARLECGNILVTPAALNKGQVEQGDLVELKPDGAAVTLSRKPSSESDMHLFIYRERPDVGGVVHAHPPHATGFATAHLPLTACLFPEVIVGLGAIPLASYATPSTPEVAGSLAPHIKSADAILLANHGVVTCGVDVQDAYFKMEKVEHAAHITLIARILGGEKPLSVSEVEKLAGISKGSYGKDFSAKVACEPAGEDGGPSESELKEMIREVLGRMKEKR